MMLNVANVLPRVKIALAVTALASTLQVIYHPGKGALYGPLGLELTTFLLFGLLKVLGFMTLSLVCARTLYVQRTGDSDLRKADMFLFTTVMGALLLALYVFAGMRAIQSETFVSRIGTGIPQGIAVAIMMALFFLSCMPYYRRQYYDMAVIVNVGTKELDIIRKNPDKNSRFAKTLAKKCAIYLLPLLGAHILVLKMSIKSHMPLATSLTDGLVTCALALASGYAIASTLHEMAVTNSTNPLD